MRRRRLLLGSAGLGGIVLLGSGLFPARAAEAEIHIDNFAFTPAEITVAAGTKVTWTNRDDIPHTIVDAATERRAFKSPPLDTDEAYSYVFATPGTYRYFCSLHSHMQGSVIVR
jgi:plastocyanin